MNPKILFLIPILSLSFHSANAQWAIKNLNENSFNLDTQISILI